MKSIKKQITQALSREFIEGTIYRVDLDQVDVAPAGSSGILRRLPLSGDRDKVKVGDPVKVITVAGERVALVGDTAFADVSGESSQDAAAIELAETLQKIPASSSTVENSASGSADGWDGWVFLDTPLVSPAWTPATLSTVAAKTPLNLNTEFGLPLGAEVMIGRILLRDSASATTGDVYLALSSTNLNSLYSFMARCNGITNSTWHDEVGTMKVAPDGIVYYSTRASGTNTLTAYLQIWGYKMPSLGSANSNQGGWVNLSSPLVHASWDGDSYSTVGWTTINARSTFGVPDNARSVAVKVYARDSGSAASVSSCRFAVGSLSSGNYEQVSAYLDGVKNDVYADGWGVVNLDDLGQLRYRINASGVLTMDCYLEIWGYLLGEEGVASGVVTFPENRTSASWTNKVVSTSAGGAKTRIDLSADFGLPDKISGVFLRTTIKDALSATVDSYARISASPVANSANVSIGASGLPNNTWMRDAFFCPCDANGDIWINYLASGANSMTISLEVSGYLLPVSVERANAATLQGYAPKTSGADTHALVTTGEGGLTLDGSIRASSAVSVRARRTTHQSISHIGWNAISLDYLYHQTPSDLIMWSVAAPSQFIARVAGVYIVTGGIQMAPHATGVHRYAGLRKNGTEFIAVQGVPAHATSNCNLNVSCVVQLNVGDYVELCAFQDSGGALNVISTSLATSGNTSFLSMARIA